MGEKIRLNIGAGDTQIPGFISLDIKTGTDASQKLDYADGSVDEIYASHVLEHIHHSKTHEAVREWVRVLRPGGRIRIAVPDSARIAQQAASGVMPMNLYSAWMHGSHDVDTDRHQAEFNREHLESLLRGLGIEGIGEWKSEYEDCSRLPLSLNLGGYKRQIKINRNPKVVMVLSTGRFGPIDLYHGVAEHCRVQGWELLSWGGDNWAKALTGLMKKALDMGADYILSLDFDSCFDAAETVKLVEFMQEHPDVGAVWPVQAHRHQDTPLGYAPQWGAIGAYNFSKDNPWKGEFTQYGSGHFGCTVIRRELLTAMERPWFKGLPSIKSDPSTPEITQIDWDNDALDNDISFWVAAQSHGFVFGQLNSVQIGHMEWCIKWVAGDKIGWQPIQHYRQHGRPKWATFDGEAWNKLMRKKYGIPEPEQPKPIEAPKQETPKSSPELSEPSNDLLAECDRLHAAGVNGKL